MKVLKEKMAILEDKNVKVRQLEEQNKSMKKEMSKYRDHTLKSDV